MAARYRTGGSLLRGGKQGEVYTAGNKFSRNGYRYIPSCICGLLKLCLLNVQSYIQATA